MVRVKHRYILFEILYPPTTNERVTPREDFEAFSTAEQNALFTLHQRAPSTINHKSIMNSIRRSLQDHYGDVGAGSAGMLMNLKYFSNKTSTGIIRCGRAQSDTIIGAMTLIERIDNCYLTFQTLHVSGTIKKCEEYSITRTKQIMCRIGKWQNEQEYIHEFEQISADEDEIEVGDDDNE
ncbi:unnamed protein product [Candida verbasci]|uniref:Ribonuclease P/MRP protein subunit POP5 n=1 Tax=Candida verbasci TaxID=1227364 RepID=A0A9W4TW73_9ASCO|nr:unnamed protein product [Candida verbasci]